MQSLRFLRPEHATSVLPILKVQEIPLDHPDSARMFNKSHLVATPGAIEEYREETIFACLVLLQEQAIIHQGIERFQVFRSPEPGKADLWFIEDGVKGAITALLSSDYYG